MSQLSSGWVSVGALALLFMAALLIAAPAKARGPRSAQVDLTGTTPLEAQFFTDLRDGRAGRWSLADAFFIASGIRGEADLKRARDWIDQATSRAHEALKRHKSVEERADYLLRWVHQNLFSSYQARSTDAISMIRAGRYNCLSSCLIYGVIAERLGLYVTGIAVDRHAFCRVYSSASRRGRGWDVETTTPLGFNPGRDIKISNAVVSVPRSRYRNRREMSLFELMGLLYTNHMGLNQAYPGLRDRLLAYQKATLFHPTEPTIQHNLVAAHTQLISRAIDRADWSGAWAELEALERLKLSRASGSTQRAKLQKGHLETLTIELVKRHVEQVSARGQEAYALEVLAGYLRAKRGLSDPFKLIKARLKLKQSRELLASARSAQAQGVALERFNEALKLGVGGAAAQRALSFEPETRKLLKVMTRNHLASAKNLIIDALNAGDKRLARQLSELALKRYPRDLDFQQYRRISAPR